MPAYQEIPPLAGEQVIFAADFTPSPILRNNKSGLIITSERVAVLHPQHVFLFFQVGQTVSSAPISKLAEVTVGRLLSRSHLRSAIFAGFIGLFALTMQSTLDAIMGPLSILVVLLAFGVAAFQLWLARHLGMTVQHAGGGTLSVRADRAEHQMLLAAADLTQQLMIGRKPATP
ncbi:MAG: hypothetical protein JWR48_2291 [Mycobacterium sp.]|nr:hypothetical protein [Mycobacterium sp.]